MSRTTPSLTHARLIARTELRRKRRAIAGRSNWQLVLLAGIGLFFLLPFAFVVLGAYTLGEGLRMGSLDPPLNLFRAGVSIVVLFVALTVLTLLLFATTVSVRDSFDELLAGADCCCTAVESAATTPTPVPIAATSTITPSSRIPNVALRSRADSDPILADEIRVMVVYLFEMTARTRRPPLLLRRVTIDRSQPGSSLS